MYLLFTIHILIVSTSPFGPCQTFSSHIHILFNSFNFYFHFYFYFYNPFNSLTFWRRAGETDKADDLLWRRVHLQRRPVHRHGAEVTIAIIIFDINTIFAIIINFIIITISSSKIIAISTLTTIIRSRDGARNLSYILDCLTTLGWNEPSRCDQTSNCLDESDEDNCRLLSMKVGHIYISVAHFCIVLFHVLVIS